MASPAAPLDPTAGPVPVALACSHGGGAQGYRARRQPQADAQIAFPVAVALVAPNAITR